MNLRLPPQTVRRFLFRTAALCLGFYFPANAKKEELISAHEGDQAGFEFNAWMRIDTDGKVTLTDHRAEMGQGSYQSVPQIIAEELEVDPADLVVDTAIAGLAVTGVPGASITFAELASRERLFVRSVFLAPGATYPFGAHVAVCV